jgi:DNA (cytosine-5)-methyltransferase 1
MKTPGRRSAIRDPRRRPQCLDLFAGCGGLSLGLLDAGFDISNAVELNEHAARTYALNHPETDVHVLDAYAFADQVRSGEITICGKVDLVCGGPPCQGFSGYNRFRTAGDKRNELVSALFDVVGVVRPRAVLIENVVGILSTGGRDTANLLLEALRSLEYKASLHILQAGGYGVPQNRWRVFLVGTAPKVPDFRPPEPTHCFPRMPMWGATSWRENTIHPIDPGDRRFEMSVPLTTVWDAISDLPRLRNGECLAPGAYPTEPLSEYQRTLRAGASALVNHETKTLGTVQLDRVRHIPKKPGSGWNDLPEHLKPLNLVRQGHGTYDNRFGRL